MTIQQNKAQDPKALLAQMMRKELFVILNTAVGESIALQAHLMEHLHYLIDLEKRGVLFASGPFSDAGGQLTGSGLTIIRARSFEEAEAIAKADPFAKAGLRMPHVQRWTVNEGRIQLSVDLSDRSGALP